MDGVSLTRSPEGAGHSGNPFTVLLELGATNVNSADELSSSDVEVLSDSSDSSYSHIGLSDEDFGSEDSVDFDGVPPQREIDDKTASSVQSEDLCSSINGMYRILDLITEQGSSGLVDKIIISQDSLKAFINGIKPSVYHSLTKVDFKALDHCRIKPIGIYGSKDEIVRFLLSVGLIDDDVAGKLVDSKADSKSTLRSGLYIIRTFCETGTAEHVYVIYWPEDSTWDDTASPPVRRNRATFMRYLTKICDQVVALISDEHAKSIVWGEQDEEDELSESDEDDNDRLFTFEVAKTREQEESVSVWPGFKCVSEVITSPEPLADTPMDPESLKPRLVYGETRQGIMTARYLPGKPTVKTYESQRINEFVLEDSLRNDRLQISETLGSKAAQALVRVGLTKRFPDECRAWLQDVVTATRSSTERIEAQRKEIINQLDMCESHLAKMIRVAVVDKVFQTYPSIDRLRCLALPPSVTEDDVPELTDSFSHLTALHTRIADYLSEGLSRADCKKIRHVKFRALKDQLVTIDFLSRKINSLSTSQLCVLIQSALHDDKKSFEATLVSVLQEIANQAADGVDVNSNSVDTVDAAKLLKEAVHEFTHKSDGDFISDLESIARRSEMLQEPCMAVKNIVEEYLTVVVERVCNKLVKIARRIQEEDSQSQIKADAEGRCEREVNELTASFIQRINSLSQSTVSRRVFHLESLVHYKTRDYRRWTVYRITGSIETLGDAFVHYTIHLMQLTVQDQHDLQLDSSGVRVTPTPRLKYSYSFQAPLEYSIVHSQLLENDKLLLVLVDRNGDLVIFLDHLTSIENAVRYDRGKVLRRDKIGQEFLLAFDESNRMLVVVSCEKLQLHVFIHDVGQGFTASGSAINLIPWHDEGTTIVHACIVCGSEEVLLIDSQAVARVFSLVTMQFRPASLDLQHVPTAIWSSPDGSCFLASRTDGTVSSMTAFHWSTFGSTDGHPLAFNDWSVESDNPMVLTSLARRTAVHLVRLNLAEHSCSSVALDITRRETEFTFKEKDIRGTTSREDGFTAHNCLLDCHVEVWTRFPVLPAVQRSTISSSDRSDRSLLFVSGQDHARYSDYFANLIENFERTSKKPTGDKLSTLSVSAMSFADFAGSFMPNSDWKASQFKCGEWIVEILCLIPIHLALARDNRFIPLKDGVYSTELEKSLLGADINRIVDSISFGWYESIFQSYMADKPVRVVSSMGEQSVGKSFALNHFVDTSFAGSAMRTTEGVWMSVTPTKDALIVALDFEGVHSIERSAQEDTLLVLFNTAISNLVLFRNNFALSRDITGLFQSFQSSSTVLDPVANPSLFQSTLVIIIKDVVDADKVEIAREFSLKFQQIVQDEQDANFISRLHGGKLNIIPWPVIESREFYKLFPTLKRRLDQQDITHKAAGEFLHLMKTLMAKLKANDWGALSQTMAAHRTQLLLMLLPTALACGLQNAEPDIEPLKNLDTDVPLDLLDTDARFFVSAVGSLNTGSRNQMLRTLQINWGEHQSRQFVPEAEWVESLSQYLEDLVDTRSDNVRTWVTSNVTRFQAGHASVMELHRTLESALIDLKSNVQLCRMRCEDCELTCIQNRLHDGPHDCQTDHSCSHNCSFCVESQISEDSKQCSMAAGHSGPHVCVVTAHLCGAPCNLLGKAGCQEECIKVVDHDDEHHCAAKVHACGEPCGLSLVTLADGSQFKCTDTCRISSDVEHESHRCDAQYCPISCQLCKRLCSSLDHLHAFESDAIHLCGQEHPCSQRCTAPGVCEIDTAPHSIEAMFTGRHESFQYTKYSQVAKRLKCVKTVPPGKLRHEGSHVHSLDLNVVHFCEERCASCEYFCTLPLGHPQQEHETRHGSMSKARWSIDGPEDESLEVEGRRFSTNDEGAPMLCNLVCQSLGRHVHVDYCRAENAAACKGNPEILHIATRLRPDPDRIKDFLSHKLFWKRSGFKDPYSREEQANFAKCDSMCSGLEHSTGEGKPSYCTLPLFHAPLDPDRTLVRHGYVSQDGHQFMCPNPINVQQPYHIIFLIDKSASMGKPDREPLVNSPVYHKISSKMNNRLGAVYSSLYSFWTARMAGGGGGRSFVRQDAYTIIMHDQVTETVFENDLTTPPDQLLDDLLTRWPQHGNAFNKAFKAALDVMVEHWSEERPPVIIFLSDGIAQFSDRVIQRLFQTANQLGKGLSLHTISFGPTGGNLRGMIEVALNEQSKTPKMTSVPSSYHEALDTVQLAETFLGIAKSLRKPRGALMR